jgi:hypothetical protein
VIDRSWRLVLFVRSRKAGHVLAAAFEGKRRLKAVIGLRYPMVMYPDLWAVLIPDWDDSMKSKVEAPALVAWSRYSEFVDTPVTADVEYVIRGVGGYTGVGGIGGARSELSLEQATSEVTAIVTAIDELMSKANSPSHPSRAVGVYHEDLLMSFLGPEELASLLVKMVPE